MTEVYMVRAFPMSEKGGNPAPIVLDADGMSSEEMRNIATHFGHESGFILTATNSDTDFKFRFFVPHHEMEMCGHATIAALWVLREEKIIKKSRLSIDTMAGQVNAIVPKMGAISISQPAASITEVDPEYIGDVLVVLGLKSSDLARPNMLNSCTSRIKTMIALKDASILQTLEPDFEAMKSLCDKIGSTGLYPFASGNVPFLFHARQFPRSSGYQEDAATGIAAAALSFSLLKWNMASLTDILCIRQGEAMGCPSEIGINFQTADSEVVGCWISGICEIDLPNVVVE